MKFMLPTLAEVLELPELKAADPIVLAGHGALSTQVRWLHVSEQEDIATYLKGGELLLTTGRSWGRRTGMFRSYIDGLVEAGAAGLLVRPHAADGLPEAMITRARDRGFPLIQLRTRIAFVDVTEVVHEAIISSESRRLARLQKFEPDIPGLVMQKIDPADVVVELSHVLGRTVVHEDSARNLLTVAPNHTVIERPDWQLHSRRGHEDVRMRTVNQRQLYEPRRSKDCIWSPIIVDGGERARVHVLCSAGEDALDAVDDVALERAAHALSVALSPREQPAITSGEAGAAFITDLRAGTMSMGDHVRRRAADLGIKQSADQGVVIALTIPNQVLREKYVERFMSWQQGPRITAIAASEDPGMVVVLIAQGSRASGEDSSLFEETIRSILNHLGMPGPEGFAVGIGRTGNLSALGRSLSEAVAAAEIAGRRAGDPGFLHYADLGAERLFAPLIASGQLDLYIEQLLGPLLDREVDNAAPSGRAANSLRDVLEALIDSRGQMSEAARVLGLDRRTVVGPRRLVEQLLDVDLSRADHRLQISAAIRCHALVTRA